MRANIIKIGNSNGVIIPKGMMQSLGISEKSAITMQIEKDGIRIRKAPSRDGWEEAAKRMRANEDDELLIPSVFDDELEEEW